MDLQAITKLILDNLALVISIFVVAFLINRPVGVSMMRGQSARKKKISKKVLTNGGGCAIITKLTAMRENKNETPQRCTLKIKHCKKLKQNLSTSEKRAQNRR